MHPFIPSTTFHLLVIGLSLFLHHTSASPQLLLSPGNWIWQVLKSSHSYDRRNKQIFFHISALSLTTPQNPLQKEETETR